MKTVLIVEDSEDDIVMVRAACERIGVPHRFQVVTDGAMALEYLSGNGAYADRKSHPLPDVLLLDIKMPKRNGHEVLEWIRSQPELKELPVVMLTGSDLKTDVTRAYKTGATSYLQKIPNLTEFEQNIRLILKFWLELETPPPQAETAP